MITNPTCLYLFQLSTHYTICDIRISPKLPVAFCLLLTIVKISGDILYMETISHSLTIPVDRSDKKQHMNINLDWLETWKMRLFLNMFLLIFIKTTKKCREFENIKSYKFFAICPRELYEIYVYLLDVWCIKYLWFVYVEAGFTVKQRNVIITSVPRKKYTDDSCRYYTYDKIFLSWEHV